MFASFQRVKCLAAPALMALLAWLPASASARSCPFDGGGSGAINDGVVMSFLATGCAAGPSGAFVQGGNAFGSDATLATND